MRKIKSIFYSLLLSLLGMTASAYDFESGGIYYNVLSTTDKTCEVTYCTSSYNSYSGVIDIPSQVETSGVTYQVTAVGANAFRSSTKLESVKIPDCVTSIGGYAFYSSGIKSVVIGAGVLNVGSSAFYNCNSLYKMFILPNTVPSGLSSSLNSLSGRVTYVANSNYSSSYLGDIKVYKYLSSMFSVGGIRYLLISQSDRTCDAVDCDYTNIPSQVTITSKVTNQGVQLDVKNIQDYAFYGCTGMETLKSSNTGNIGANAFENCVGLKTVELSNAGSIGNYAFSGCNSITTFTFGEGLRNIGAEAFSDCTAMTSLSAEAAVPPVCGNQALDDINKWSCRLYVPSDASDAYKAAEQWKEFFFVENLNIVDRNIYVEAKGNPIIKVGVSASPVITFSDTELLLSYNSGKYTWAFTDFERWYFGRVYSSGLGGIDDISKDADGITLKITTDGVNVSGAMGKMLTVVNTAGVIMERRMCREDTFVLSVKSYPIGVYIINVGSQTLKLYVNN